MKRVFLLLFVFVQSVLGFADSVEIDGIYYNLIDKGYVAEVTSNPNTYIGEIIIPDTVHYDGKHYSVVKINDHAFENCEITSISMSNNIERIGDQAFSNNENLISVTLSKNLKNIGQYAFYFCKNLESIYLPDNLLSIAMSAFEWCTNLTSINIPSSVKSIGDNAFCNSKIKSVYITDISAWCNIKHNIPAFDSIEHFYINNIETTEIDIPDSFTTISKYVFANLSCITSIKIPNSVTFIDGGAFYGCSGITSIEIPNTVTGIHGCAFENCTGLTSIDLPQSVTYIGYNCFRGCSSLTTVSIRSDYFYIYDSAFENCKSLSDIYCYSNNPPIAESGAFRDSYIEYITLHVPKESISTYKDKEPWKNFKEIVAIDDNVDVPKCSNPIVSYENGIIKFSSDTEGVDFVSDISNSDIQKYYTSEIYLAVTYNISVYAIKTGYENSDVVYATLCWIDAEPKTEGISNGIAKVRANPVLIQSYGNVLCISGVDVGTPISVFDVSGKQVGSADAMSESTYINTSLTRGQIGIVKIGEKAVKIIIK